MKKINRLLVILNELSGAELEKIRFGNLDAFLAAIKSLKKGRMTLKQLLDTTYEFDPKRETRYPTEKVPTLKYSKMAPTDKESIIYSSVVQSSGKDPSTMKSYTPMIGFTGIDADSFDLDKKNIETTKIRVRCTCHDFYYSFASANNKAQALIGEVPEYTKVAGSDKGPVNPKGIPGMCKHIFSLYRQLKKDL